jgi:hypothetical protein
MPKGESFFVRVARQNRAFAAASRKRPDPMAEAQAVIDIVEAPDELSAVDIYLASMGPQPETVESYLSPGKTESVAAYLDDMSPRGESVSDVLRRVSKIGSIR